MRAASTAALVHRTLHPPMIPRISSADPSWARSPSASSADRGGGSPWCLGRSTKRRRPPPLPQPSRVRSGWGAEVQHPFWRPLAAPAAPVANAWVPGGSPPDGAPPLLGVGCCLSAHWRHWQALGAESWVPSVLRDGCRILCRDSPPLARTPISFPTSRAGSPRSLALCQVVVEIFSMTALEIILDPCPGLSGRLFLVEKIAIAWHPVIDLSHPNEFVLQSPFMIETVASVLLSIREGDFLASVALNNGCFLYPIFRIRGSFSWFPVMWGSLPVRGPVSWTVDCP